MRKLLFLLKILILRLPVSKNLIIFCWIFLANKRQKFKWGKYRRSFCRSNAAFSMKPWAYQSDQLHAVTIVSHLKPMFDVNRSTFAKIFTSSCYGQFCQKYHVLPCHLFYLNVYACSLGTEVKSKRVLKRICGTNAAFSVKPHAQALDQLLQSHLVHTSSPCLTPTVQPLQRFLFVLVMLRFARNIMFFYAAIFVWMINFFVFTCFMWVTYPGLHFLTVQNYLRHHSVYCLQTYHLHKVHCQKIVSDHDNETFLHAATTRSRITIWVNQESFGPIKESKHQI